MHTHTHNCTCVQHAVYSKRVEQWRHAVARLEQRHSFAYLHNALCHGREDVLIHLNVVFFCQFCYEVYLVTEGSKVYCIV